MKENKRTKDIVVWVIILVVLLAACVLTNKQGEKSETISEVMKDAVLHEDNRISLFGVKDVNPGLISAYVVTAVILVFALIVRIFVIPRFKYVPGKFQMLLESWVGLFDNLAKSNSPHRNRFLGAYVFAAGSYIFTGTLFELFGVQVVTTEGMSMALPAPLSDINAAIALGCLSYLIIMSGGIAGNGLKGVGLTLKDFSLPISMSFRLFGALLSGLLVTELVYYYITLSFVLPVAVGLLFTLLHALIQTYVLTMLTALFYGEVSEPSEKKPKKAKKVKEAQA
jgi:F-type H+-transporting ATPase subunit a